jgi:hypothetical protein
LRKEQNGVGGVDQDVELLCKYEALSSNPNPTKKKELNENKRYEKYNS